MNENEIRKLFPNGSADFFANNFGLRTRIPKQDVRPTVVHPASGKTESDERPVVSIVLFRVRLLDKENAYGATKPLTDCLCKVGLLPGDATNQIELTVSQQKVAHKVDQRTEVTIDYK